MPRLCRQRVAAKGGGPGWGAERPALRRARPRTAVAPDAAQSNESKAHVQPRRDPQKHETSSTQNLNPRRQTEKRSVRQLAAPFARNAASPATRSVWGTRAGGAGCTGGNRAPGSSSNPPSLHFLSFVEGSPRASLIRNRKRSDKRNNHTTLLLNI